MRNVPDVHEGFSEWQSEVDMVDRFRADGWFASDDPNEIIRVEETWDKNDKPIMRVKVNVAYANQDPDAVAMMTTFALSQHIFAETRRCSRRFVLPLIPRGGQVTSQLQFVWV